MAKLLKILLASLGGGVALGLGLRLGENLTQIDLARTSGSGIDPNFSGAITRRLEELETRLETAADRSSPGIYAAVSTHEKEIHDIRQHLSQQTSKQNAAADVYIEEMRSELQHWVTQLLDSKIEGVEKRLKAETSERQQDMLDAFTHGVQTRVVTRIAELEKEVTSQGEILGSLQEHSIQTEQNMQELLLRNSLRRNQWNEFEAHGFRFCP